MIRKLVRLAVVLGVLSQSSSAFAIRVCAANVEVAFKVPDGRLAITASHDGRYLMLMSFDTSTASTGEFQVAAVSLPLAPKLRVKVDPPGQLTSIRFVSDGKESPIVSGWEGLRQSAIALLYTIQTSLSFETDTDGDMRLMFAPKWEYMSVPMKEKKGNDDALGGVPPADVAKSWDLPKGIGRPNQPKSGWTWHFDRPLSDKEKQKILIDAVPCIRRFYLIRTPHPKTANKYK